MDRGRPAGAAVAQVRDLVAFAMGILLLSMVDTAVDFDDRDVQIAPNILKHSKRLNDFPCIAHGAFLHAVWALCSDRTVFVS